MKKYIEIFWKEIEQLFDNNFVFGGSWILKLHGLEVPWIPQDLDIILFDPTPFQVQYVLDQFEQCLDYETEEKLAKQEVFPRSYQLEREGYKLNIILAYDDKVPPGLLLIKIKDKYFKVDSIDRIIEAKLSYLMGKDKKFPRRKDIVHLNQLKNSNFNVNE